MKENKVDKITQYKMLVFAVLNLALGVLITTAFNIIPQMIREGLYHKILIIGSISIPVGVIGIAFTTALITIEIYIIVYINYIVLTKGINILKVELK